MKKNLTRAVVLGLLCASAVAGSAYAEDYTESVDDSTASLTITRDYYKGADVGYLLRISGNNDKDIILKTGTNDSTIVGAIAEDGTVGILHTSNGTTTISYDGNLQIDDIYNNSATKALAIRLVS